jgi:Nuclease-related domain
VSPGWVLQHDAFTVDERKVSAANPEPAPRQVTPPAETDGALTHEYERRSGLPDRRALSKRPYLIGLLNRRSGGERRATKRVQELCGKDVLLLLHRKLGAGRKDGELDLVAVGPAGVYVVDVKNYQGKKVELRISGGLFSQGQEQLFIGGRESTRVVDVMARRVEAVRVALLDYSGGEDLPVTTALCFVDADLPAFQTLQIGGHPCLRPKSTARLFSKPGRLDAAARTAVYEHLERRLPPAR